jgi:alkane 1-monooxygenase
MHPTAAPTTPSSTAPLAETIRVWALHLLCLVLPVSSLVFLATAPHSPMVGFGFVSVLALSVIADMRSSAERRQPAPSLPAWPFNAVLYLLVAMQLLNMALLVRMVAVNGFWRADTFVAWLLVGVNSGYSAIVVAHELIHRAEWLHHQLGRLLLCTTLYEHFSTEHIRGHHSRVGTAADPATARFGETAVAFLRRTVPAQFRSAWRLESKRLGDEQMRWSDPRILRHRVLHGLLVEWGVVLAIGLFAGLGAAALYVLQAALAVRLLEAVNYFEHYGLVRTGKRVRPIDSWDTDSRFTLYTLIGLSRHADHHAYASRPYQQLRYFEESPKLRYGYFGTVVFLIFRNAQFRAVMAKELERRQLGPFAPAERVAA